MSKTKKQKSIFFLCLLSVGLSVYPLLGGNEGQVSGIRDNGPIEIRGKVLGESITQFSPVSIQLTGLSAEEALVFRLEDGYEVGKLNENKPLAIASITKLMTSLLAISYLDFQHIYEVKSIPTEFFSPSLRLSVGDKVRIQDLFEAVIVGSANDAAYVLGTAIQEGTGKNILTLMNDKAKELNMQQTRFVDPAGLSGQNKSTAMDLKLLVQAILKHPAFDLLGKTKNIAFTSETGRKFAIKATNKLPAKVEGLYALKTGHTEEAKGAMITRMELESQSFIIIVLGSNQREKDTLTIAQRLKDFYPLKTPLK